MRNKNRSAFLTNRLLSSSGIKSHQIRAYVRESALLKDAELLSIKCTNYWNIGVGNYIIVGIKNICSLISVYLSDVMKTKHLNWTQVNYSSFNYCAASGELPLWLAAIYNYTSGTRLWPRSQLSSSKSEACLSLLNRVGPQLESFITKALKSLTM